MLPSYRCDESMPRRSGEEGETLKRLKIAVAFRMLASGIREMVPHAIQLLPSTKVVYSLKILFDVERNV